ncbi:hypothetical protein KAI92_01230 [Candidatus Parcubacteria bacterium]|nr:hypothetical protein [Candidatus Parcubacteria bacterium]
MSLEATHIRFALDLKNKYQVQDIEKYISGTIYPDSHYVTKIDRELTHNDDILNPAFAKDDFKKGWQVHQICDIMQNRMKKRVLPKFFSKKHNGYDEQRWIISTSMKIIQDMNDMQQFPIQKYLKYLAFSYNPNGENINEIKKYNQIMVDLYKDKKKITVEDNFNMWLALGINEKLGIKIKTKTEELLKDEVLVKKIEHTYIDMLNNYKDIL